MSEKSESETRRHEDFYNVAVYIDYENVVKTLINNYTNPIHDGFFDRLRIWAKDKNMRLVKTAVYCNFDVKDLYESHHQSLLQSYGVETIHTSNQGKNYADLKIAIDVLNEMYTNSNIDEFIIMSNDKDMTPLLNTIKANKRRVSVITVGDAYNKSLVEFADDHFNYEEIIKTKIDRKLHIETIADKFITAFHENTEKNLDDYFKEKSGNKKIRYSKHLAFEYFVSFQSEYHKVMQYEILTFLKTFYAEQKIIFYKYKFKGQHEQICVLPSKFKERFIKEGLISLSDIVEIDDFDKKIQERYEKYLKKYLTL